MFLFLVTLAPALAYPGCTESFVTHHVEFSRNADQHVPFAPPASRRLHQSSLACASSTTSRTVDAASSPDGIFPARLAAMDFTTTCAVVVAGLVYAHRLVCVTPPGALRFVLLLPCVAVNAGVPTLRMSPFGPSPGVLACAVAIANFGWWTNFKLLALSAGRGQLAGCSSLPTFLAVGALPIRLSDERARAGIRRGERAGPIPPAEHFALALLKLFLLAVCLVVIPRTSEASAARHLAQSFGLYAVLGVIMDVASLVAAGVFGLHLAPHFDKPFLAASISEFWAQRWNLVAGAMLRDLVYAPIVGADDTASSSSSSSRTRPPSRLRMRPIPHPVRSAAATVACFAASGAMHEFIFWYLVGSPLRVDGRWALFFLAQAPVVLLERAARRSRRLAALLRETPRPVAVVVALGAQLALANALFFPPVAETGLDRRVVEDVRRLLFRESQGN